MSFIDFFLVLATLLGASLEYYDYMLFNLMLPIISPVFIGSSGFSGLTSGYLVNFLSSILRPLGAFCFGYIGDKYGRRSALFLSMALMSISSLVISFLPGYGAIGFLAPIILFFCRILQVMSAAGELNGSAIFLIETFEANGNKRFGFASGLAWFFTVLGMLGGAFASYKLGEGNWRQGFLVGAFIGVFALALRLLPKKKVVKLEECSSDKLWINFICVTLIAAGISGMFYYNMIFFFGHLQILFDATLVRKFSVYAFALYAFALLFFGILSDSLKSPFKSMFLGSFLMAVIAIPSIYFKSLYLHFLNVFILAAYVGPSHRILYLLFPPKYRYRGISVAFGIGTSLIGSLTTLACSYYIQRFPLFPGFWLIFVSSLGFCGSYLGSKIISKNIS